MAKRVELQVHLAYDEEAKVWFVAKTDIPGLSLEAPSAEELLRRIVECAPELIELNADLLGDMGLVGDASKGHAGKGARATRSRPPFAVRPVFDAPLSLACA